MSSWSLFYIMQHVYLSYAMRTFQITPRASAFERGVTNWYQSFDCSEPGFFLESSLQSLGSSQKNNFYKKVFNA
ncbi:hypothetical protein Hanom_Chr03g00207731 [Helianthus anomalus]